MAKEVRKSGIQVVAEASWGMHFCLFYKTREDLLEILTSYFQAGLENNEFCMWVTSEPLNEEDAKKAMREALPDFDSYLHTGQIEIVSHTDWYLKDGVLNLQRVLKGWINKLNRALARGYDGMRVTGNTAWLEKKDWRRFADYEAAVDDVIGRHRMMAVCTYFLEKCGASEIIDVVCSHQFALIRREGNWEVFESSEQKRAEEALKWELKVSTELAELANTLIGPSRPIDEIAELVLDCAKSLTESEHGYASSIDVETGDNVGHTLTRMMEACPVPEEDKRIAFPRGENGRYGGLWGHSLNTGEAFYTNSPQAHESSRGTPEGHIPIEGFLSAPVMIGNELFGQIALANPRRAYTDHDLDAIKRVAALYALALQRQRVQEELLRHQQELEQLVDERTAELVAANERLENEIAERRRAEQSLEERLSFETLFSKLSARFVNLPSDEVDEEIDQALASLIRSLGVDRSTLFEFSEDMKDLRVAHSRAVKGCKPMPAMIVNDLLPWYTKKLRRGEMVLYSRPDDLPDQAWRDREHLVREGFLSKISIPLAVGGSILGAITFGSSRSEQIWPDELIQRLRLVGEILANAVMRKRADEALRRKEEGLAEAQRIAHLGNWDWNILTNELRWTDEIYRIFGLQPQEFGATYDAFLDSVHPDDRESVKEAVNRALADPNARYSIEHRIVRPDGSERIVHERGEVTFDAEGRPMRMIGTIHDVTARKQVEEEAGRLREELNHVTRVATMGELAASFAHQINQPLAAILSNAQAAQRILASDAPDVDEAREALTDIAQDGRRAGEVIRRLRALLKRGDLVRTPLCINEIVQEIASLLHSETVVKGVSVKLDLDPELPPVSGDRIQLQQVILNLLVNGMEAVSRVESGFRELAVRTTRSGPDTVEVAVQDLGTGIEPENLERIFEPFFTTKGEGLGMGLSINRSIIAAHGGQLWATNNPDRGATFYFTLPISQGG